MIMQSNVLCRLSRTSLHLFVVLRHVVWSDAPQELDVVVTVELGHLLLRRLVGPLQTTCLDFITNIYFTRHFITILL